MNRVILIQATIFLIFLLGCTHEPSLPPVKPVSSYKTVTPSCATCPTDLLCANVDDIVITTSTTFKACEPQPSGQGSFVMDPSFCYIWTPNGQQTDIVTTCIVACNGSICDSTYITIYPPMPVDTMPTGVPCKEDVIYFEKDVLPILNQSCAYTACHNTASAAEGVILDNYSKVISTGRVKPFNLSKSKIYEVITKNDPDDIMPPPPSPKLTTIQINIIAQWILQGAKNEMCDINSQPCNTVNISYATYIKPALASCTSCHRAGNAGGGINLDSYAGMKAAADNGRLYGSISWTPPYKTMPQGSAKLGDCTIKKIKSWIDAGAPNN
ncbi:MAG: hypothetical protein IPO92_00330 [Saprospiraceae bacterium]|nr:hypothetical protein [Saprospiraceae bacterium]